MVAMANMRRTAAERKAEGDDHEIATASSPARPPEKDDIEVRLEHHHIQKLGLKGPLPHGTKVSFAGDGEVADSGTREGYDDAEPRHHMTIRLRRAGVDASESADARRGDVRGDVEAAADAVAAKKPTK
jgi:hypothetical protein